jgi:hypothetical protein
MVVNGLSYPGLPLVVVALLNLPFDIGICFGIRHQVGGYLIEELRHFFVAAKEVVEYLRFPQLLHVVGMINECIEEAYVRGDAEVIVEIRTPLIGYQVQELGPRRIIHCYLRKIKVSRVETTESVIIKRYVCQGISFTRLQLDSCCSEFLHVAIRLPIVSLITSSGVRTFEKESCSQAIEKMGRLFCAAGHFQDSCNLHNFQ